VHFPVGLAGAKDAERALWYLQNVDVGLLLIAINLFI
jgi:hypothetical protein